MADAGAEIRCSGSAPAIHDVVEQALTARERAVDRVRRRTRPVLLAVRLAELATLVVVLVVMFGLVRRGEVDVSALVVVVLLVPQVARIGARLQNAATTLTDSDRRLSRFQWLQCYAAEHAWTASGQPAERLSRGIRLDGVGFTYPQATGTTLTDLSLTLAPGSVTAVVGENGAGKSTLVKLLARLYDPSAGAITVDGADLRTIDVETWRSRISAVIQDHQRFRFRVRDTVGIGDLAALGEGLDDGRDGADDARLQDALARAGADSMMTALERGLDTQLGESFVDGVSLSGGQWQRLAIARGLLRPAPLLMLLDEPSSSLDPEAEHRILTGYLDRARSMARRTGGITVIVSHRLSTVRDADEIVFLADGRVVEHGTHDELVRRRGPYAEMFALQAKAYRP